MTVKNDTFSTYKKIIQIFSGLDTGPESAS